MTHSMRERFCENVNTSIAMAASYQAVVVALVVEEPLKDVCTVVVFSLGCIVGPAVGEHPFHVRDEEPLVHIVICFQPLCHGFHVHGELHMLIVVRHSLSVHRIKERPGTSVVPACSEDGLHNIVEMFQVSFFVTVSCAPAFVLGWRLPSCLKNAWDGFNGNLTNTVFETCEAWVHLTYLLLFPLDQLLENFLLLSHHCSELDVNNPGVEFATHEGRSFIVLDIPPIHCFRKLEVLAEALLLKVAHCKLISKCEKVHHPIPDVVVLEMVHQVGSVAFNLLIAGDSAEDNLRETLRGKCAKANASNWSAVLDQSKGLVFWVEHQSCDVLLRHPRKLMGEDILKGDQPKHSLLGHFLCQAVGNAVELYDSFPFLHLGSLISGGVLWEHGLGAQHPVLVDHPHNLGHLLLQALVLHLFPLHVLIVLIHDILCRPLFATCSSSYVCHPCSDMGWRVLLELGIPNWRRG